jgi:hypothetical protein
MTIRQKILFSKTNILKEILEKLYPYSANKAVDDILNTYDNQKYVI